MAKQEEQFDVVRYIRGSNAIEGIYDEKEVQQSLHAWEYLMAIGEEFTHADICRVQKIITLNQTNLQPNQRGYYRNVSGTNVSVGGRLAPDASMVEHLMQNWLLDWPKMTPLIGHIRFELIHPFVDGNGRTGRMIYWFTCLLAGKVPKYYGIDRDPELSEDQNRQWYYRLFDQKKVIELSNNNWGIDFKANYGVRVKGTDGRMYSGDFVSKPTIEEIKKTLPKGVGIQGEPMIKEYK